MDYAHTNIPQNPSPRLQKLVDEYQKAKNKSKGIWPPKIIHGLPTTTLKCRKTPKSWPVRLVIREEVGYRYYLVNAPTDHDAIALVASGQGYEVRGLYNRINLYYKHKPIPANPSEALQTAIDQVP